MGTLPYAMRWIGSILAALILVAAISFPVSADNIENYVAALNDSDAHTRLLAVAALGSMGDPRAIDPIIDSMKKYRDFSSDFVNMMSLIKLGKTEIDSMLLLLKNEDSQARVIAALALGSSKDERAVAPLEQSLTDSNNNVREASALALGVIGDPQAVDALILALEDKDLQVRGFAAVALGSIGDEKAKEPLLKAVDANANNSDVQAAAELALESIGKPRGYFLAHSLDSRNETIRISGALSMVLAGDAESIDSLTRAMQDENDLACLYSAFSLALIANSNATDPLIKILDNNTNEMGGMASIALGFIGEPALDSLTQEAKADNKDARQAAVYAMGIIGAPAEKTLIESMEDSDAQVRLAAVNGLGLIGDTEAVESLKQRLNDNDSIVQLAASRAIERLSGSASKSNSIIKNLSSDLASPQKAGRSITWKAETFDSQKASLQFRFKLSGPRTGDEWQVVRDWTSSNSWTWYTSSSDIGESQISFEVRDGKNDGVDGYDDSKISEPYVISDPLSAQSENKYDEGDCSRTFKVRLISNESDKPNSLEGFQISVDGASKGMTNDKGVLEISADNGARIAASKKEGDREYIGRWTAEIECYKPTGGTKEIQIHIASNKEDSGPKQGGGAGSTGTPEIEWDKTFDRSGNDFGYSVQQTSDGGYIAAGRTELQGSGKWAVWLIKTDANGNMLWDRTFEGINNSEIRSVKQTSEGGYILAGVTSWHSPGLADVWLIKTDASGNMLWDKIFSGSGYDYGYSVQQTSDGGYIITGLTYLEVKDCVVVWLIKTDANGNMLWDKTFGEKNLGGSGLAVQQTSDDGYIVTGETYSRGGGDIWLIKTDASGNMLWDRIFGGSIGNDEGRSVQQTSDGGYIITGLTYLDGAKAWRLGLTKTDDSGNTLWDKTFGGSGYAVGNSVQQTSDGGYIVTGTTELEGENPWNIWLIKTDASGNMLWDRNFGGSGGDEGNSVQQTSDGGYIITGTTLLETGDWDVRLIKLKAPSSYADMTPVINVITSDLSTPQTAGTKITWTADAMDPDGDTLLYRFLLSGPRTGNEWHEVQGWGSSNTWIWDTTAKDVGEKNQVAVEVRDGKHDGEESYDDRKESDYYSIKDDLPNTYLAGNVLINGKDYEAYIKTNATFTKDFLGRNINDIFDPTLTSDKYQYKFNILINDSTGNLVNDKGIQQQVILSLIWKSITSKSILVEAPGDEPALKGIVGDSNNPVFFTQMIKSEIRDTVLARLAAQPKESDKKALRDIANIRSQPEVLSEGARNYLLDNMGNVELADNLQDILEKGLKVGVFAGKDAEIMDKYSKNLRILKDLNKGLGLSELKTLYGAILKISEFQVYSDEVVSDLQSIKEMDDAGEIKLDPSLRSAIEEVQKEYTSHDDQVVYSLRDYLSDAVINGDFKNLAEFLKLGEMGQGIDPVDTVVTKFCAYLSGQGNVVLSKALSSAALGLSISEVLYNMDELYDNIGESKRSNELSWTMYDIEQKSRNDIKSKDKIDINNVIKLKASYELKHQALANALNKEADAIDCCVIGKAKDVGAVFFGGTKMSEQVNALRSYSKGEIALGSRWKTNFDWLLGHVVDV